MDAAKSQLSSSGNLPGSATIDLIRNRQSFRGPYSDRAVPNEVVDQILLCGLSAPSSKNARPWRLHVVTDRALIGGIASAVANADSARTFVPIHPHTGQPRPDWPSTVAESAATLAAAPVAIFVENTGSFSQGRATIAAAPSELLEDNLFTYSLEVIGVGTAIMNMWIAALSLDLQAAFMGDVCVADHAIADKLGLTGDLAGVLVLGYSASDLPSRPTSPRSTLNDAVVRRNGSEGATIPKS